MSVLNDDTRMLTMALNILNDGNTELVAATMVAILRCQSQHRAQNIALDTMADLCEALNRAAIAAEEQDKTND